MVGAPTYEGSLFPIVEQVLEYASHKKIRNKLTARFGSYGWSGGAQRRFLQIIETLKWELVDTLEFVGRASEKELAEGKAFGARFAQAVREAAG